MKNIHLANGKGIATVDDADYRDVRSHGWCLMTGGGAKKKRYAMANVKQGGGWRRVLMHRFIMRASPTERIDHIDGDGLNNTRGNLRLSTAGQNQHNSGPRRGSSRFKGVSWSRAAGKWLAQIMANRKRKYLGIFSVEEDAARAYDMAARELHGEFARVNFT